jgi:hypothetical protein
LVGPEGSRWPFVPITLGMLGFAAGAADGHQLVVGRAPDWPLLVRADLELLGASG